MKKYIFLTDNVAQYVSSLREEQYLANYMKSLRNCNVCRLVDLQVITGRIQSVKVKMYRMSRKSFDDWFRRMTSHGPALAVFYCRH